MYRGFNLKIEGKNPYSGYEATGRQYHEKSEGELTKRMATYLKEGAIDATAIQNDWFGQIKADVFISHSHADRDLALSMSGWLLTKYGLTSFVDSSVWGYADDLLREIDDEYCLRPSGEVYDYESRNRSTSHVHMMLSTALSAMIDQAECIIFLNTPQSIVAESVIKGVGGNRTASPWIYAELVMSQVIRKRTPLRIVLEAFAEDWAIEKRADSAAPPFHYEVDKQLEHLTPLDSTDLLKWEVMKSVAGNVHSLDVLYRLKPGK